LKAPQNGPTVARPGHRGRRVLLADGSRFFRSLLGGNLEQAGIEMLYAHDGDEAYKLAQANAKVIDACLIDLGLMRKGALELVASRRQEPELAHPPMLLMASSVDVVEETLPKAHELKAQVFEKRLVPFETILGHVSNALEPHVKDLRSAERKPFFTV